MSTPILATKLYLPQPQPRVVFRARLIERLKEGLNCRLILISAPAGFGKSTLISEWLAARERPSAWLSLEEGDNDPTRFLAYLVAVLQTIEATIGRGVLGMLGSPQPPPIEAVLTALLNGTTTVPDDFVLVLDDYHVIDAVASWVHSNIETRGKVMRSSDLIRAARLDGKLYEEVKANTTSTGSALGIVTLVALAHGTGGFGRWLSSGGPGRVA